MSIRYAEVIGDPIDHSKSPLIHNFWLAKLGLSDRFEYRRHRVRPAELESYFAQRRLDENWRGSNVTIPHKEATFGLLQSLGAQAGLGMGAAEVGAVNTVCRGDGRLVGHNTDVDGVAGPLSVRLDETYSDRLPPSFHVAIIGAGGAARAALSALTRRWPTWPVTLLVRRHEQGRMLLDALRPQGDGTVKPISTPSLEGVDIVINASPLGMTGKPPLALSLAAMNQADALVFDMVYAPLRTALLEEAIARGMDHIDGLEMLIAQAASAFRYFFDADPPQGLTGELRGLLTA